MTEPGGIHIIADGVKIPSALLMDDHFIKMHLEIAAKTAGATVLNSWMHHFGEGYGVTGVIVLAESHISVHTWPESGFAAFDIFMCGEAKPMLAISYIQKVFPGIYRVQTLDRKGKTLFSPFLPSLPPI